MSFKQGDEVEVRALDEKSGIDVWLLALVRDVGDSWIDVDVIDIRCGGAICYAVCEPKNVRPRVSS